jgi:hypothetical protein
LDLMSIAIDEHQYRDVVLLFDSCAAVIEVDEAKHESHGYFRFQFLASMPRAIPRDLSYGITPGLCTSRRDLYDSASLRFNTSSSTVIQGHVVVAFVMYLIMHAACAPVHPPNDETRHRQGTSCRFPHPVTSFVTLRVVCKETATGDTEWRDECAGRNLSSPMLSA